MKTLHISSLMRIFARENQTDVKKRRRPVLFFWLCSMTIGVSLTCLAFPNVAQGCGGFFLQALGPEMARPGDLIVYTIHYQNLGWTLLDGIVLAGQIPEYTFLDSLPPDCQQYGEVFACFVGPLAYKEGGQVKVSLRVDKGAPAGTVISGKVVAVSKKSDSTSIFLNSTQVYTEIVIPALTVTNQPDATIIYAGELVTYTYTVTNAGDVPLKEVTVVDDHKPSPQVCASVPRLEPNDTFTCTWTTALDADTTNVATVTGLDPWGDSVVATASASVNTLQLSGLEGGITLQKVASASAVYAGETVVYTYTVTNLSDDPLYNLSLVDDKLGLVAGPFDLEAVERVVFTASTVLTADTTNVATAEGQNLLGDTVRAEASAFVDVVAPDVAISLALNASAPRVYAGDTVTYTYVVDNPSSDTAYGVVLTDDLLGTIAGPFDLAGGQSVRQVVSQRLDEDTTNVATATGSDDLGKPLLATATAFVDTIQRPGPNGEGILSLTVTPSAEEVEVGTVVTYTYVVTNLSPDPINQVVVMDDQFGFIDPRGHLHASDLYEGFTLQGRESRTLTLFVPLYESKGNVATVSGQDLLLTRVLAEARAFVSVRVAEPARTYGVFLPVVSMNAP